MPSKIFISYRRDDVPGDARGIRDALAKKFGNSNVFMDVDNLLAGQRFDKELDKALNQCDVLIAVMGPRWMELISERRTSNERDYVREEIAAALKRNIVVIPVRAGREDDMPPFPRGDDLPEDIRELVLHQKHDVAHERFRRSVEDLIASIKQVRGASRRSPVATAAAALAILGITLAFGTYAFNKGLIPWPAGFEIVNDRVDLRQIGPG